MIIKAKKASAVVLIMSLIPIGGSESFLVKMRTHNVSNIMSTVVKISFIITPPNGFKDNPDAPFTFSTVVRKPSRSFVVGRS